MNDATSAIGRVTIAPQVLTTIVRQTALSNEGVQRLVPGRPRRSRLGGRRAVAPGIEVIVEEGEVQATVRVIADPTANMIRLAESLQDEIARAIDHIVGLRVSQVNVYIDDVFVPGSGP